MTYWPAHTNEHHVLLGSYWVHVTLCLLSAWSCTLGERVQYCTIVLYTLATQHKTTTSRGRDNTHQTQGGSSMAVDLAGDLAAVSAPCSGRAQNQPLNRAQDGPESASEPALVRFWWTRKMGPVAGLLPHEVY